jgi:hypothetical protein
VIQWSVFTQPVRFHHALGTFGRHELREQRGSGGSDEMLGVRRRDALDERSNRHHGGA